jgi:hypothetical protein
MLPGSHGAGTNDLYESEASTFAYSPHCPSTVDKAAQGINWITRQWAMAQTLPAADEAATGSRWFELRGVLDNYIWRSCDGLITDRWFDVVDGLAAFQETRPGEVMVIDIAQVLDPITNVSATRLTQALAPVCRRAVGQAQAPMAGGVAGMVTIEQARDAGGFVLQMTDSPGSRHAYTEMTRWLAAHPSDPCHGKLWSRRGTRVNFDDRHNANLWLHRHEQPMAAARMVHWNAAHLGDSHGSFQVSQFTWDFSGPSASMRYQIWLMNHWLIDYNHNLVEPTRQLARSLRHKTCMTGIPANVILLDNISLPGAVRELVALNDVPCP